GRRQAVAQRYAPSRFVPVRVIGMAGAEGLDDIAVVATALVGIANQQTDGRAGGVAFKNTRQNRYLIGLATLRDVPRCTGPASIELFLNVGGIECQPRRAAIDHATDGRAMRFAEIGDTEQFA